MEPLTLTSVEDTEKAAAAGLIVDGAQFIIDTFPPADAEDQLPTEEQIAEATFIQELIAKIVAGEHETGDEVKTDPLASIRGMTAAEIDKQYNKAPMADMIEAATGVRPPTRTKAADLAAQLEELAQ